MNNFNLISSCKKLSKQILLSNIVASLLFSSTFALPSGGKFTHNTSGNIITNGNNMHINGNGTNSVIQWGGGFSIGKGESVNFNGNNKNYLNIAHGTSKSTIDGLLNANGNNVFLINPNGVIITKNGTINANRFVASTSSMDNAAMQRFANMSNFNDGLSFSPVFKPSKAGNVVNMGNINADSLLFQGNKILLDADTNWDKENNEIKLNQITAGSIDLKGNEIYVDISTINSKNLTTDAKNKGIAYLSATGYYCNPTKKYNDIVFTTKGNMDKTYNQYISIGSDIDWWHFAKGWNENKAGFRDTASEYRLTNDIDFKGNKGQGEAGKDWQNYANYCIDGLGCTSMIVGFSNAFTKTFDGQGYTLKNINIDTTSLSDKPKYVGIFGKIENATIKNINVDYMGGGIKANGFAGGFAGEARGTFTNISLNNIGNVSSSGNDSDNYAGGFAGEARGTFTNISLNNIGDISSSGFYSHTGGFSGRTERTNFTNIFLNNIGNISSSGRNYSYIGGFAGSINGNGTFSNISLNNIGNISSSHSNGNSYAGGFAGWVYGTFSNISLNNIGDISSSHSNGNSYAGGFAGGASGAYTNISLNNIGSISSKSYDRSSAGGFAGDASGVFTSISLNNIGDISSSSGSRYGSYAGGFVGYINSSLASKNIYIFFNPNMSISASGGNQNYAGKFVGYKYGKLTFNNVHIYHKDGELTNATADKNYWGNSNDKIQIHTYNNSNQESVYQDFLSKANTISKPTPP
ncbi:filamentous hemagglutinin N-terminal domain-containing protein, partial [Campylobacter armoricus]|uniref:two-partner secretion domain-containing protein n=2 Tax=Campylobacter armoricus TaxID=2505970 RepID=UPI001116879A